MVLSFLGGCGTNVGQMWDRCLHYLRHRTPYWMYGVYALRPLCTAGLIQLTLALTNCGGRARVGGLVECRGWFTSLFMIVIRLASSGSVLLDI